MNEQNEALIRRWFDEVWNNKNEAAIDEMLADDVEAYGLVDGRGNPVTNKETFMGIWHQFTEVYPDLHVEVEDTLSDGDRAMARCRVTGTHRGSGFGFPATGTEVNFTGVLTVEVKDGKIIKAWNEFNFMTMFQQLGAVTLAAPTGPNEAVMRRWFEEVWNQGREEVIDELFPDGLAHGLGDEPVRGAENYKPFFHSLRGAMPDVKITVEDSISEGDKVAMRCRISATHTGQGLRKNPTNKPLNFEFIFFARIKDGKIAEAWNVVDFMKMYSQIDALDLRLDD